MRKMILILLFLCIRLLDWQVKFEKHRELQKVINEELMPVAWHSERWWDFCVSEEEKKEVDPIFIEEL